jgi:hypothetical protein
MTPTDRGQAIPLVVFGVAIVTLALTFAVLEGPADQLLATADTQATASSTQQGIDWVGQMITYTPAIGAGIIVLGLLADSIFEGGRR